MPLDDLSDLIKELRERIDTHDEALKQSEALTRYALIDPLLRALGWNTADPAHVVPEYRLNNNQIADYVLFDGTGPAIVLESKKLNEQLQSGKALDQGILYCAWTGSRHFVLTDGRRYEIYNAGATQPSVRFDLLKQDPAEAALQALALWRPGVQAGLVTPGHPPVLVPPVVRPDPPPPPTNGYDWQPLSELSPQPRSTPPVAIRFPDNSTAPATAWNSVLVETVRWLINGNYLIATHCPIRMGNTERYTVAATPVHSNGQQFRFSAQVGPLYVEKFWIAREHAIAARSIVERLDQDPSRFHVGFAPPK